ncbi:N-acetyltransferase GCN5 [Erwinia tracheiphila PSU-1]|nr:N-acetyltransferase GCN5 [Erwinia tracheiphila PSU-1]
MNIRLAHENDSYALSALLDELGYENNEDFISARLAQLINDRTEQFLIVADGATVLGFLSLHFIPQLALA